jgi:hypothetical protein
MHHAIEHAHFGPRTISAAPPHWAVVAVKCCVVGILLLPVSTLLWLLMYKPTEEGDLGPIAFMVSVGLGLVLYCCAALITSTYPPVPAAKKS